MRILYTIADLQPESGGPSHSVSSLAAAVAELGTEVELLALEYGSSAAAPLVPPPPVRTTLIPCRGSLAQRIKWTQAYGSVVQQHCAAVTAESDVRDLSRRNTTKAEPRNAIIHDTGLWLRTNHAVAAASRQFRLPRVVSPSGMLTQWALHHRGWKKKLAWRLYQQRDLQSAQVLHATSAAEINDFRAAGLSQPIALIPNGVWLPPQAQHEDRRKQKAAMGAQKAEIKTILFLGRIHPIKGLANLVAAWALVRGPVVRGPWMWRVVIAGGGEPAHIADLRAEIRRLKMEHEIELLGPVEGEAKWELYRGADVFVLPSHSENFGLVVAEALACGVPVIASRGTPWEDLTTYRCGWWVEMGAEPLAIALSEALSLSDEERRAMGLRGRKLVEGSYTWPASAKKMISVYAWVLRTGPKPPFVLEEYVNNTNEREL